MEIRFQCKFCGFNFRMAKKELMRDIGKQVAKMHDADIIHRDLTTSNLMVTFKEEIVN